MKSNTEGNRKSHWRIQTFRQGGRGGRHPDPEIRGGGPRPPKNLAPPLDPPLNPHTLINAGTTRAVLLPPLHHWDRYVHTSKIGSAVP